MRHVTTDAGVASPLRNAHGQDHERLRNFLATGLDLVGRAGATAYGVLTGATDQPFLGTTADWAVLRMLNRVAEEFADRSLSGWERARAAAVVLTAVARANEYLQAGNRVRRDDFFIAEPGRRSAADECAEAILLIAQREPEEVKLPFVGNLLAGIAFRDDVDRAATTSLVRLAAILSFRQFGLLAVFSHTERLALRMTDYNGKVRVPFAMVAVLQDVYELVRMSLVVQTTGEPVTMRDLTPGRMTVAGMGSMLAKLMGLSRMDADEIEQLAALLR